LSESLARKDFLHISAWPKLCEFRRLHAKAAKNSIEGLLSCRSKECSKYSSKSLLERGAKIPERNRLQILVRRALTPALSHEDAGEGDEKRFNFYHMAFVAI
jgi:hypothetical protein